MSRTWLQLNTAATRIGKSVRTIRRWRERNGCPASLFKPPVGRVKQVDVDGLTAWAAGQNLLTPGKGRPSDVERLTRADPVEIPTVPTQESANENESAAPAPPAAAKSPDLTQDELAALRAAGLDEDAIARMQIGPALLRIASAAAKCRRDEADAKKKELDNQERAAVLIHVDDVRRLVQTQAGMVVGGLNWIPGKIGEGCVTRAKKIVRRFDLSDELEAEFLGAVYDMGHDAGQVEFHALLTRFSLECPW